MFLTDVLVPNETEARVLCGHSADALLSPHDLACNLREVLGPKNLVITMGERGAFVLTDEDEQIVPALSVQDVADTAGAGDSFTAALTYGLAAGGSLFEAARFGTLTAARAITIRESGSVKTPQNIRRSGCARNPVWLRGVRQERYSRGDSFALPCPRISTTKALIDLSLLMEAQWIF